MRLLALVILALTAAALLSAPASAYVLSGRPWPGTRITYYPRLGSQADEADRAARTWNRANVGITFKRGSRSGAQVLISYGQRGCGGVGTVGYQRGERGDVRVGRNCNDALTFITVVHELGHVLGLGHEKRVCARMNPSADFSGTPSRCDAEPRSFWVANPLEPDDIAGARDLYE